MPGGEAEREAQKAEVSGGLRTRIWGYAYSPPRELVQRGDVRSTLASLFRIGVYARFFFRIGVEILLNL